MVFEPIPEVANHPFVQKKVQHFQKLFSNNGIQFMYIPSWDQWREWKKKNPSFPSQALWEALPFYSRNFSKEWMEFQKKPAPHLSEEDLDTATIQQFSIRWTAHYFRNLTSRKYHNLLIPQPKQTNSCNSYPFLFIGAGPQFEDEIPCLFSNANKYFILASDTALGSCLAFGIQPNAVLSIDPGLGTYYHLIPAIQNQIPILTWLGGVDLSFLPNDYPIYYFLTYYPLDQFLQQTQGWDESYLLSNPTRNIAGIALSLCSFFGFSYFFTSGMDFIGMHGKTHARGTGYEIYYQSKIHRKQTLESLYPLKIYGYRIHPKNQLAKNALQTHSQNLKIPILQGREGISQNGEFHPIPKNFFPEYMVLSLDSFYLQIKKFQNQLSTLPGVHPQVLKRYLSR